MKINSNQKKIAGVGGAIIILLIVIGVNSRLNGKQQVLAQSFDTLLTAETLHTKANLTMNLPQRLRTVDRPFTKITVAIEGDAKKTADSTPELAGMMRLEAAGRGNIFFADGEVRILKDEVLFNLENLPVFLNPTGSLVKKWTRVESSLLTTANGEQVKETLLAGLQSAVSYTGSENVDGQRLLHYQGSLTPEQEEQLISVARQGVSGNRALGALVRLVRANNVKSLDIWIDASQKEVRKITVYFVRPLADGSERDFATLTLEFEDYGKEVVIDRPDTNLRVRPDVFTRIFGTGEVEAIAQ